MSPQDLSPGPALDKVRCRPVRRGAVDKIRFRYTGFVIRLPEDRNSILKVSCDLNDSLGASRHFADVRV